MAIPKNRFSPNFEHGRYRNPTQVDRDLNHVEEEIIRRKSNFLIADDEKARYDNLREARGSFN